jgi:hypothetical protein
MFFRFIGNNTIEIYFIHYLLLFTLPMAINEYLSLDGRSSFFKELLIIGSMDLIICAESIVVARIIKSLPYFSRLFFGR